MLRGSDATTAFEGVVECLGFEAVAEDEHIAWVLFARCCDNVACIESYDLILDEFDFRISEALEVLWGEDYAFAARCVLSAG